jgi:diguanylate cyclase (GGDEF)-like protein
MRRVFVLIVLACMSIVARHALAAEQSSLTLHAGQTVFTPADHLQYWVDPNPASSEADAEAALDGGQFKPVSRWPPTFGFADGVYWFALDLRNVDHVDDSWLYVVEYALLDHLDLYLRYSDGREQRFVSGDREPYVTRSVDHRYFNFSLRLPRGQSVRSLLRVQTESSVQVPIAIYSDHAFLETHQRSQLGLGVYYGVLIGLLLYNLLIFLSVRDRSYPYYIGYVALFGLALACLNGISYQILWPTWPLWDDAVLLLAIGGSLTCMVLFTNSFLELPTRQPVLGRMLRTAAWLLGAITLASPFFTYRHAIQLETASVFLLAILMIGAGISAWRHGYRPAYYFLLAWSFMVTGIVVYACVSFGVLPKNFLTEYGIQFGSGIEMILLSLGLAYRFKLLREQNLQLQLEATERLEHRVSERTNELNRAMGELRTANRRLHEFSLRDGLTGVHNRRYLDETLAHAVAQARERKASIALLMIDIDHFKRINDTCGHLAGDDCLRTVADVLRRHVREGDDFVARYGGEEFVVLLPGATRDDAARRGEILRCEVAALRIDGHGATISLTISLGLAAMDGSDLHSGADKLIRAADAALYRAKREGRNRLVIAD